MNRYYQKNERPGRHPVWNRDITTSEVTTHYYLGRKEIALRKGSTLSYVSQDHLTGTSVISDNGGMSTGTIRYVPFGETRSTSGAIPTDKKFTGQRLDGTGLYYYNARYYDPGIGRFTSPDTFVQSSGGFDVISSPLTVNAVPGGLGSVRRPQANYPGALLLAPVDPQALNRYSYVLNNPLRYNDPEGWWTWGVGLNLNLNIVLINFSVSVMYVWDDKGGTAGALTRGFGGATPSVSLTGQYQSTDADTIGDLAGWSGAFGGSSGYSIITAGAEKIGSNQSGYEGTNYFLGLGLPVPAEVHGYFERTSLFASSMDDGPADNSGPTEDVPYDQDYAYDDSWDIDYSYDDYFGY